MSNLDNYIIPSVVISLLVFAIILYLHKRGKLRISQEKPIYDVKVDITTNNKIRLTTYSGNKRIKEFKANGIEWAGMTAQEMAERLAHDWTFTLRSVIDRR